MRAGHAGDEDALARDHRYRRRVEVEAGAQAVRVETEVGRGVAVHAVLVLRVVVDPLLHGLLRGIVEREAETIAQRRRRSRSGRS